MQVLVVDDHAVNRLVLSEIFTHLGCSVSTAEDGESALSSVNADDFDLVCLDRHMPGLSGDEVAARLPADVFVLAWSTDIGDLPERFNGVLAKPITVDAARGALQRAQAWRARGYRGFAGALPTAGV